jgi:hypothetical protein
MGVGTGRPFFHGFMRIATKSARISLNISCGFLGFNEPISELIYCFSHLKQKLRPLTEPYTDELINIWQYFLLYANIGGLTAHISCRLPLFPAD